MKYTPRVRSEIAPIASASSAATEHRQRPRQPGAARPVRHQDADRVGTHAEERGVAETHHAPVTEDEVQARGGDRVDHDAA